MEDNKLLLERDDLQQLLFLKENKERILNELDVRHDLMYKIPDNTKERRKILEMIANVPYSLIFLFFLFSVHVLPYHFPELVSTILSHDVDLYLYSILVFLISSLLVS